MIQKSSIEGKLPGFTAQSLFTYTSKASSSLKNHYSSLSASITPAQSCYVNCYEVCYRGCEGLRGQALAICNRGCKNECYQECN
jgi:hypothetical protein